MLRKLNRAQLSTSALLTPAEVARQREQHNLRDNMPRGRYRQTYSLKEGDKLSGFAVTQTARLNDFDINAFKLEHEATGLKWLHLDCADMDNVFALMLRTPADDHTGKPHILERLAQCGSHHYPVRDPFSNMGKRSLNTFMSAWTGSDFTMYPFSTQNAQDYRNLLSVYTDMAFKANI